MTLLSEEKDVLAPADAVWRVVSNSAAWPLFFFSENGRARMTRVEYLGREVDELGAHRRCHFVPGLPWDEQVTRFEPPELLEFRGTRTPGMRYWQVRMELIPNAPNGGTTLRWDIYYDLSGWNRVFIKQRVRRILEGCMLHGLQRIEALAQEQKG